MWIIFTILAVLCLITLIYLLIWEPVRDVEVITHKIDIEDWDAQPLRIGILADPHVGLPNMSLRRFHHICRQLNALDCDIIMLLGDYRARYLYKTSRYGLEEIADAMLKLNAPLGVWGVLGNHDWWDDHETMKRGEGSCISEAVFREAGLQMLENENTIIDKRFNLVGLGDQWAFKIRGGFRGVDDLTAAMKGIDRKLPTILMAHEPDVFSGLDEEIVLTISGHTHGGQVVVNGKHLNSSKKYGYSYLYGHYKENDRHLVVSGGLGTSVFPLRFGRPPELTIVEIQ